MDINKAVSVKKANGEKKKKEESKNSKIMISSKTDKKSIKGREI